MLEIYIWLRQSPVAITNMQWWIQLKCCHGSVWVWLILIEVYIQTTKSKQNAPHSTCRELMCQDQNKCCCFLLTRPFFCHLRIFLILYYSSCSYHRYAVSTRWEREVEENGPIRDYNRFFCCCARRLGNMFILWGRSDGSPIVVAGPCWPFCVLVTLVSLLQYNALFSVLQSWQSWAGLIAPSLLLTLFCLLLFCRWFSSSNERNNSRW